MSMQTLIQGGVTESNQSGVRRPTTITFIPGDKPKRIHREEVVVEKRSALCSVGLIIGAQLAFAGAAFLIWLLV